MNLTQFEELLCKVVPLISKETLCRESISVGERLCMTLRFLASGDSMISMSYRYLLGLSNIILETCDALWSVLSKDVFPYPFTKEKWLSISKEIWDFNHCIGAIDGKHIIIQCPENAGSYFNYKNSQNMIDREVDDGLIEDSWRKNVHNNFAFREINQCTNTNSRIVAKVRDDFNAYFNSKGATPWQFNYC
ncbi:hypothetical protein ALC56_03040 [Trachymyrmex septentrionalis]|uniref:DDE Tnp4 domain-containing protein n=1 Tax=Trachymyrmex septentrionalis TaxID=34720 RepID=A0A195FRF5_9HYME|nr:hypothetical protein ALC56_03040 [Trachymyrmex septentrionalis]